MIFITILWVFEIYLIINSAVTLTTTNYNLGSGMMYFVTVFLFCLLVFRAFFISYTASGFGFFLKILFFIGLGVFLALVLFIASSGFSNKTNYAEKSIIVLGAGLKGDKPGGVLKSRLDSCIEYYEHNQDVTIVVTGGQGNNEIIPEAVVMKNYLVENNIPADKIIVEDRSTSTKENLLYAKQLLQENGIDPTQETVVATSNFHCYRADQYAQKQGFTNVVTLPSSISMGSVIPCYMREAIGVLLLWFFG